MSSLRALHIAALLSMGVQCSASDHSQLPSGILLAGTAAIVFPSATVVGLPAVFRNEFVVSLLAGENLPYVVGFSIGESDTILVRTYDNITKASTTFSLPGYAVGAGTIRDDGIYVSLSDDAGWHLVGVDFEGKLKWSIDGFVDRFDYNHSTKQIVFSRRGRVLIGALDSQGKYSEIGVGADPFFLRDSVYVFDKNRIRNISTGSILLRKVASPASQPRYYPRCGAVLCLVSRDGLLGGNCKDCLTIQIADLRKRTVGYWLPKTSDQGFLSGLLTDIYWTNEPRFISLFQ